MIFFLKFSKKGKDNCENVEVALELTRASLFRFNSHSSPGARGDGGPAVWARVH